VETTYLISIEHDAHGHPLTGYALKTTDSRQYKWLADTEFGPFDTWVDAVRWLRKVASVDLDARFS
jgi:hypothetical protein